MQNKKTFNIHWPSIITTALITGFSFWWFSCYKKKCCEECVTTKPCTSKLDNEDREYGGLIHTPAGNQNFGLINYKNAGGKIISYEKENPELNNVEFVKGDSVSYNIEVLCNGMYIATNVKKNNANIRTNTQYFNYNLHNKFLHEPASQHIIGHIRPRDNRTSSIGGTLHTEFEFFECPNVECETLVNQSLVNIPQDIVTRLSLGNNSDTSINKYWVTFDPNHNDKIIEVLENHVHNEL